LKAFYTGLGINIEAVNKVDKRDVYISNRGFFVDIIDNVEHFLKGIDLTPRMKSTILHTNRDKYQQVELMLDILHKRPVDTFSQFLVAFRPYIKSVL